MRGSQALPASLGLPATLFTRKGQGFPIKSQHKKERAKRGDREEAEVKTKVRWLTGPGIVLLN